MPAIASCWLNPNPFRYDDNATSACTSSISWILDSRVKQARRSGTLMGSFPLKWWWRSFLSIHVIKSSTLPLSLEVRSWLVIHNLYRRFDNTILFKLLDSLISFKPRYFAPRLLNLQLVSSLCWIETLPLVFFLRRFQTSSSFELDLLESHSFSEFSWPFSLKVSSPTTCCEKCDALIVWSFWEQLWYFRSEYSRPL